MLLFRYAAIIVAVAAPVAEVLWLLPLPFITLALKITLLFFPPAGVSSLFYRDEVTASAFTCFPVWQLAYASLVVQVLVSE